MNPLLLALALAFQSPSQTPAPTPAPAPLQPLPSDRSSAGLTPAHDLYFEDSERLSPVARAAVHQFGACVAAQSAERASEVLSRDFTTRSYRSGLRLLARANEGCFRRRGRMVSHPLLFAGAIAEKLIAHGTEPLNARLVRAAARPAPPPYSPTDRMAICVVRSVPDDISRLFAAEIDSDDEASTLRALELPVRACSSGGPRMDIARAGLRAMFATAAYRTLAGAGSEEGSN